MRYAKVVNNKIVYRDGSDALKIQKLEAHAYTAVIETESPVYNTMTQYTSVNYELVKDRITKVWTIHDRDPKDIEQIKLAAIEESTIDKIRESLKSVDRDLLIKDSLSLYDMATESLTEVSDVK